jgi:hypothetical protein
MTYAYTPKDYSTLQACKRKRCMSCGELIEIGAIVALVHRVKIPEYEIECKIYGEDGEIPRAPGYLCEGCADICFSLDDLGFCVNPYEDMRELLSEYVDMNRRRP